MCLESSSRAVAQGHPASARHDRKAQLQITMEITFSTTSTNDWASSPTSCLTASVSSRSEKMFATNKIRSSKVRERSIRRFHAGLPLHVENRSAGHVHGSRVGLTNDRKFAVHVDVGELPGPSIVVPAPINGPSNPGGSAVAGVRHAGSSA